MQDSLDLGKLNKLQLALLRIFQREMSDEQVLELQRVLTQHFQTLLHQELHSVCTQKKYKAEDFEAILRSK